MGVYIEAFFGTASSSIPVSAVMLARHCDTAAEHLLALHTRGPLLGYGGGTLVSSFTHIAPYWYTGATNP